MFEVYGVDQKESNDNKPNVDFEKLNQYVVDTAQLEQRETLVGYVSMLVDLGTQEQEDAAVVFTGSEQDEQVAIAEKPLTYFKNGLDDNGKPARLKCWPQKPIQCVAVAVDFPEIVIDKGSFFGESKPLPLRLWLGGQFYIQDSGMVIGRPTPLKVNKKLGDWSLDQKHLFYKMAVADKLIKPGEVFKPQRISELLGKAFQFEAQVFFKESKGKKYYTEYIKFVSGLGRGQSAPEIATEPMMIQFNKLNDDVAIKELRAHVVNTLKRASNYQGSQIQKQIESVRGGDKPVQQEAPKQESKPSEQKQAQKAPEPEYDPLLDDIPFNRISNGLLLII